VALKKKNDKGGNEQIITPKCSLQPRYQYRPKAYPKNLYLRSFQIHIPKKKKIKYFIQLLVLAPPLFPLDGPKEGQTSSISAQQPSKKQKGNKKRFILIQIPQRTERSIILLSSPLS